jgi:iron complex outermembrane receptor protein
MECKSLFKKFAIFFCTLFTISITTYSQCQLAGKIKDASKATVPYAAIALINSADSSIYKGTLADEKGNYCFNGIKSGVYIIKTLAVGFVNIYSEKIQCDSTSKIVAPDIILKTTITNLNEATVNAIKDPIEFKNGNIIVNIEGSPLAVGNSVYDLLSHLPGVTVENDKITIEGNAGVKIYIDDRVQQMSGQQLINLLRSINSSSIEKIEILKNPPVKYDAGGAGGIINIKTKKIKITGFSGSVNYNLSQGFYSTHTGGLSLNYKWNKVVVFSNFDGYTGILRQEDNFKKSITSNSITTVFDQKSILYDVGKYLTCNLAVDWYVNKKSTLGFRFQYLPGYAMRTKPGDNFISDNSIGYTHLSFDRQVPNSWTYRNYNFNAEHLFDTLGTKLTFSTDYYAPYFDEYLGTYQNRFLDNNGNETSPAIDFKSNNTIDLNIISSKLDFEKKVSKTLSLEMGIKESYTTITSDYILQNKNDLTGAYTTDSTYTNKFTYKENISAAYVNLQKEVKKFHLQAGLRAENTDVHTESILYNFNYSTQYFRVFPVMSVDYKISEKHMLQLSYNNRINRPGYESFNPYKSVVNVLTSNIGNPYLMPTISNTIFLTHSYNRKISNSLSYRRVTNPFIDYPSQNDSTKETIFRTGNLKGSNIIGYSLFIRTDIFKWWSLTFATGAYYVDYVGKINGADYTNSSFSYRGYLNNQFLLSKNIKIELTYSYTGPRLEELYNQKSFSYLNIAVKKSFLKDKLNLTIGVNDLFRTSVAQYTVNFQDQKTESYQYYDGRRVNIGISYNFGALKVEQRDASASDTEQQRMKH